MGEVRQLGDSVGVEFCVSELWALTGTCLVWNGMQVAFSDAQSILW